MRKRLTKSHNKIVAGVFGGIAEYFNWDKAWTRICGCALMLVSGWGIILYIVAAIVMPEANHHTHVTDGEFHQS
ncbi:PspC domain-containing protein [Lactobacillus sp. ESL0684]|uniref:PspC domain-containing protein n=1 Tax=unclassified Lactobacillus TaxID=2620435 RepID=UPI0023F87E1C|nr:MULTISPECIES: PspC domain-containing protein [unclassified Lactobacillus]WEV40983.1 PspC domain-containing protein [Lactobacillus sp. ESL0681]WEV44187.1 PspC domain-containing protein [Lactobacillus sp. ESL0684]